LHRSERRTLTTKQVRETEAESVAFVVCQSLGLETGTSSADYIQLWNGSAKLLQESLEVVQRTSAVILGGIAPKPPETEQAQEPEVVTPEPQPQPEFETAPYVPQPAMDEVAQDVSF
jgi:hypothetical protein